MTASGFWISRGMRCTPSLENSIGALCSYLFPAPLPTPPGHQLWVAARDGIRDNSPSYSAEKSPAVRATANLERASLEAGTRQTNIETSAPTWTPGRPGRDETRNADFQ